jgi:hypothetical protein
MKRRELLKGLAVASVVSAAAHTSVHGSGGYQHKKK